MNAPVSNTCAGSHKRWYCVCFLSLFDTAATAAAAACQTKKAIDLIDDRSLARTHRSAVKATEIIKFDGDGSSRSTETFSILHFERAHALPLATSFDRALSPSLTHCDSSPDYGASPKKLSFFIDRIRNDQFNSVNETINKCGKILSRSKYTVWYI